MVRSACWMYLVGFGCSGADPSARQPEPTQAEIDADQDGFTADVDCNDDDPNVHPGSDEVPFDKVDNDCDPRTLDDDGDQDGFGVDDDCDDSNPAVNPGRPEVAGNDTDDDCDPSTCVGLGFHEVAIEWAVPPRSTTDPAISAGFDYTSSSASSNCSGTIGDSWGKSHYFVADVDGDGHLDLVENYLCGAEGVGDTHWFVHPGTGEGFTGPRVDWLLPDREMNGEGWFRYPTPYSFTGWCVSSEGQWASQYLAADWNGDGALDIAEFDACGYDPDSFGIDSWRLHVGGPDGFSSSHVDYPIPSRLGAEGLPGWRPSTGTGACTDEVQLSSYTMVDTNGDGLRDIVELNWCGLGELGRTQWRVFEASPTGFATTPTLWQLPPNPVSGDWGWVQVSTYNEPCRYDTTDLTGDGFLDIVLTSGCEDEQLGVDYWTVYPGSNQGFVAPPMEWSLPERTRDSASPSEFPLLSESGPCWGDGASFSSYYLDDLDGDGDPDLVEYSLCSGTSLGVSHWNVFRNNGTAFEESATIWPLPALSSSCPEHHSEFFDLTHDGILDLVVTSGCHGIVGQEHWLVYRGACDP